MTKKLPDDLVAQLIEEGLSGPEIVTYLREHRGIAVTRQAITVWKKRNGYDMRPTLHGWAQWDVTPEHQNMEPYRLIKLWERKQRGWRLNAAEERRLESGLKFLARHGDMVFHYDPDRKGGPWFIVPRRPGVDTGIVRRVDEHAAV